MLVERRRDSHCDGKEDAAGLEGWDFNTSATWDDCSCVSNLEALHKIMTDQQVYESEAEHGELNLNRLCGGRRPGWYERLVHSLALSYV